MKEDIYLHPSEVAQLRPGQVIKVPKGQTVQQVASAFNTQIKGDHYKRFAIQPAEFITKNKLGFLEGCVIKRVCRWRAKDGIQDLRKAIHELELLIEMEDQPPEAA